MSAKAVWRTFLMVLFLVVFEDYFPIDLTPYTVYAVKNDKACAFTIVAMLLYLMNTVLCSQQISETQIQGYRDQLNRDELERQELLAQIQFLEGQNSMYQCIEEVGEEQRSGRSRGRLTPSKVAK